MSRFIDADSWANAPIKGLLEHAKTIVDAEVANGTIFQEMPRHIPPLPPPPSDHNTNNSNTNNSTTTDVVQHNHIPKDERKNQPNPTLTLSKADRIPRFDREEIKMGRVVGRGGFCVVSEIREIRCLPPPPTHRQRRRQRGSHSNNSNNNNNNNSSNSDSNDSNQRTGRKLWRRTTPRSTSESTMNTTTNSETGGASCTRAQLARDVTTNGKFVVKQVNRELLETNRGTFLKGLIDIAMEAKFLANLDHTNIIPLRGECRQSPFDNNNTDYFIILNYLPRTLPQQLNDWMHAHRATKGITGFCTSLGTGNDRKVQRLMTDRLFVAYDIAAAGHYLHEKNIIYRDFKPDNVGFTSTGVTKIIDFGLAREVTNLEKDDHGLYNLTGCTGGIRYMAPEVGLHRPYNTNADVYSWSMIFWYILSLEPPLCLYTTDMIVDRVFEKGHRPATKNAWNPALSDLLRKCWTDAIHDRPTFREIMTELLVIVHSYDPEAQRDRWTLK